MKNAFVSISETTIHYTVCSDRENIPSLNISAERPRTCTIQLTILKMQR